MQLHSRFKLTIETEEAPPLSCPPKKPGTKKAVAKKAATKEES